MPAKPASSRQKTNKRLCIVRDESTWLRSGIQPLAAFIPFVPLALNAFHTLMPLKWIALFTILQTISLLSFYINFISNDFFWCLLAVGTYILIALPVYTKIGNKDSINDEGRYKELIFSKSVQKMCKCDFFRL